MILHNISKMSPYTTCLVKFFHLRVCNRSRSALNPHVSKKNGTDRWSSLCPLHVMDVLLTMNLIIVNYNCVSMILNIMDETVSIPSQRMALKLASLKVGFVVSYELIQMENIITRGWFNIKRNCFWSFLFQYFVTN